MKQIGINIYLGGALAGVLLAMALVGVVWTPHDPLAMNFANRLSPPGAGHWLGTDEFGRDQLSRLMVGAATSVRISALTVIFAVACGTVLGVISGFLRGWVDRVIMALNDVLLAFPGLLFALGLLAVLGATENALILSLGLIYMSSVVRVVRGTVLGLRAREFVEASSVMGNSSLFTMLRHIMPNCVAPLTVLATSICGWTILAESSLSFLGLGVAPPAPTWGNMLAGSRAFLEQAVWLVIFPGLCISFSLLGINLLGDAMRDLLDPRMRNRT